VPRASTAKASSLGAVATLAGGGDASSCPDTASNNRTRARVLFLIADTGGGHRASAQALEVALREELPECVHTFSIYLLKRPTQQHCVYSCNNRLLLAFQQRAARHS
jgi:hypothetical protein